MHDTILRVQDLVDKGEEKGYPGICMVKRAEKSVAVG